MKISVVIPCYNAEAYLSQTIGSVLAQSLQADEIIVVDDGSSDRSAEIARSFGPRVAVISHRSGSASLSRLRGLEAATGDALMFLDADDVLSPDAFSELAQQLESGPPAVACVPWYRLERVDGVWLRRPASCVRRHRGEDPLAAWLRGWYHPTSSVMWSREAYEIAGGWDPAAGVNDDGYLMMRALAKRVPLRIAKRGAMYYRRLPNGEVSFSGTRFSPNGLRARIDVVRRIAGLLHGQGRLDEFRPAIGVALRKIAADCGDEHPELRLECERLCAAYADPDWRYVLSQSLGKLRTKAGALRRRLKPADQAEPAMEITYGIDVSR